MIPHLIGAGIGLALCLAIVLMFLNNHDDNNGAAA